MPRIPTSNTRQVREQVSTGQGLSAQLGDTTRKVNLGVEVAGAVTEIAKIQEREAFKAEETQLTQFKTAARNKLLESTRDPEKGFFRERGQNASKNEKGYVDGYNSFLDEESKNYAGGSDRLKAKLREVSDNFKYDLKSQYASHTSRENQVFEDEMFTSEMASLHNEGLVNPNRVGKNIAAQKALIYGEMDKDGNVIKEGVSQRKGYSKAKADQMFLGATTRLHADTLGQMVDSGDYKLANDYFNVAVKNGEIDEKTAGRLEETLKQSTLTGQSQELSEEIILKGGGLEQSKKEARDTIKDPELKDATIKRIDTRMKQQQAAKEFDGRQYYEGLADTAMQDPENFELTADMYGKLTHQQQKNLIATKNAAIAEKTGTGRQTSDMVTLAKLTAMSPAELKKYDLTQDHDKLKHSDIRAFTIEKATPGKKETLVNAIKYATDLSNALGFEDDNDSAYMLKEQFEAELNRYPEEERNKLGTLNKIKKEMTVLMNVPWESGGNNSFSDQPLFKVRAQNLNFGTPDKGRPRSVPTSSTFVDTVINGKRVVGWEQLNKSTGEAVYYDTDGNQIYSKRKKVK